MGEARADGAEKRRAYREEKKRADGAERANGEKMADEEGTKERTGVRGG